MAQDTAHTRTQEVRIERFDTGGDQELPPVLVRLVWRQTGEIQTLCRIAEHGYYHESRCPGFDGSHYEDIDLAQHEFSAHVAQHLQEIEF